MPGSGSRQPAMALCHEWLSGRRGSEVTFELMARAFPGADLYALTRDPDAGLDFGGRPVRTTFLDRIGPLRGHNALQLPLMPLAWRYASRTRYDVVVTSSHACVKGFGPGRSALHLCYCYTPMRYLWMQELDRRSPLARLAAPLAAGLRAWDVKSANWVDHFAGISTAVVGRIERFYGRQARVLHPPVNTRFFTPDPAEPRSDFVLAFSRMIPNKKLDLAIRAAALAGMPLVVAGSGPQEGDLRTLAARTGSPVEFVIAPDDETVRRLYRTCRALIFPAEEDFGIVPVEAQACGAPVVALGRGGSLDTVVPGRTGILVERQEAEEFAEGLREAVDARFEPGDCVANAGRFSSERFLSDFTGWVSEAMEAAGIGAPDPYA
ncbi:MAG TPA: glycosyltransferase [Actinomycetota bacterium]|nr:glycosyltransferase [Actinomycetota bacterium]